MKAGVGQAVGGAHRGRRRRAEPSSRKELRAGLQGLRKSLALGGGKRSRVRTGEWGRRLSWEWPGGRMGLLWVPSVYQEQPVGPVESFRRFPRNSAKSLKGLKQRVK